jgi:hypothetical protein
MSGTSLAAKLGIKPAKTVLPINPPSDYAALIGELPEGATIVSSEPADVVHAFARTRADLARLGARAVAAVRPGGLVWVSYPRGGTSELKRDLLIDAIEGWRPVSQISVDDLWSAMRFRPLSEVGQRA